MSIKTDESILYELFNKLGNKYASKKQKKNDPEADKRVLDGIASKVSLLTMRLTDDGLVSIIDIQKDLRKAKSYFTQLSIVRGHHPKYISDTLSKQIDQMMKAVCKWEAEMIGRLRMQETGGERIDISEIFSKKKNLIHLGSQFARDIVASEIREENLPASFISTYFITNTGKKYHRENCPFCKGRHLSEVSATMVEYQKLTPCKCLLSSEERYDNDPSYMTAFIDESIHPVAWNEEGQKGKEGSFSYIICRGLINSEDDIREGLVISKGVDFIGENRQLNKITEAAVGKVLLSLLYDFEFDGNVQIYTDNKPVTNSWKNGALNSKLAKEFLSVEVDFVPREMNKKADKLGRSRMLLDMPVSTYNETVKKCARVKELEKEIREKEEQIQILREQEEVIVVKKLDFSTTPSMTIEMERETLFLQER